MNNTRPLFLVPLFLLAGLFAFNSYADEVTISWEDGTYTGEVAGGAPNGQGTWTHPNGRKYVGKFKDGKSHGQGTFTFPNGRKYVGEWKDDHSIAPSPNSFQIRISHSLPSHIIQVRHFSNK